MKNDRSRLQGRTILVVEDHDDSRDAMRQIIEAFGATVRLARDGREALKSVVETRPDLILCDLRMPGMDGFTLMTRLREDPVLCRIRMVAVSGLGSDLDLVRSWEAGFDGHLVKPIDPDRLRVVFERVFWADGRAR